MNHTKGDWIKIKDLSGRTHIMANDTDGAERNVCVLSVRSPSETEANAYLIAAAPDMLKTLELAREDMAGNLGIILPNTDKIMWEAIIKAKGKGRE